MEMDEYRRLKRSLRVLKSYTDYELSLIHIFKMHGKYWQNVSMISLAGVYTPKEKIEESKIPKALVTYLKSHPYICLLYTSRCV